MAVIPPATDFGDLCDEIAEIIFSFVPLKSLAKLETVSKSWRQLIARVRLHHPPVIDSGLVLHLWSSGAAGISKKSVFLKLHYPHNAELCTVDSSAPNKFPFLIDSCNGLILYGLEDDKQTWNYIVHSQVSDQSIALPPSNSVFRPAFVALAFDPRKNAQFKVVGFFWNEVNPLSNSVNSMVFKSESWEWREKQGKLLNSGLISEQGFVFGQCFGPAIYMNSRLHLIWCFCLLIFDEDGDEFTVLPLPRNPNGASYSYDNPRHRSLWESEGKLNLCDPDEHGFRIWEFSNDTHESLWTLCRFVVLDDLISETRRETGVRVTVGNSIRSSGFNEDLQILYIHVVVCKKIVGYSFETKRVVGVWSYGDVGEDFQLHTFLFKHVGLNSFKLCQL
ncbi:hypothetical protein DM860_012249 [Cuscuta australis]|uniref:F-box domain-containing protein n=1 Tax=Cuscuta australis TaxID=267555 RepID=A0A328E6J1_9ASTE|nr:hypothetical protein DM860_012249 [Cuscuta australis]